MKDCKTSNLYSEKRDAGNIFRADQLNQMNEFIQKMKTEADEKRNQYFQPNMTSIEKYQDSITAYRDDFKKMLGYPLLPAPSNLQMPEAVISHVAKDDLGEIYRLEIKVLDDLTTYGLLFIPEGEGPHPLVISQHGGGGTPELCSNFFGSDNYNNMTRRVLERGFAVFAPQLLLWDSQRFGPEYDRIKIDSNLKQLGSSITAVEVFKIMRSLDYLLKRDDIDETRVGMIGLSYGGFYTLFTTAIDTRIKAAVSSCFFNNRYQYAWSDWVWFNAANKFLDAEVASLICPRPLYIEVGKKDELFDVQYTYEEFAKVQDMYKQLNIENNVVLSAFDGTHELDTNEAGIGFLSNHI